MRCGLYVYFHVGCKAQGEAGRLALPLWAFVWACLSCNVLLKSVVMSRGSCVQRSMNIPMWIHLNHTYSNPSEQKILHEVFVMVARLGVLRSPYELLCGRVCLVLRYLCRGVTCDLCVKPWFNGHTHAHTSESGLSQSTWTEIPIWEHL